MLADMIGGRASHSAPGHSTNGLLATAGGHELKQQGDLTPNGSRVKAVAITRKGIAMIHDLPCLALNTGVRLELRYDGFVRVVEVHAVGISTAGNPCMRVFQVRGGSVSGEPVGWKMMVLDKAFTMHLTEEVSQAPRQGYAKNDRGMSVIHAQL